MTEAVKWRSNFAKITDVFTIAFLFILGILALVFINAAIRDYQGLTYTPNKFGTSYDEFYLYYGSLVLGCFGAVALSRLLRFVSLGDTKRIWRWLNILLITAAVYFIFF